jgi:hypothetical protein
LLRLAQPNGQERLTVLQHALAAFPRQQCWVFCGIRQRWRAGAVALHGARRCGARKILAEASVLRLVHSVSISRYRHVRKFTSALLVHAHTNLFA